jgi:hypothetical protein
LDFRLATVYHELGHITNKDSQNDQQITMGNKTYPILLNEPEFKADSQRLQKYLKLGKTAFDNSTSIGRHINKIIRTHTTFWNPPIEHKEYEKMNAWREEEKRADLFMMDKLFKQGEINAILSALDLPFIDESFINSPGYIVSSPGTRHPSPIERGIYTAGFLKAHGIDVNKALKEREITGQCKPAENGAAAQLMELTQGAQDFQKAYNLSK